MKKVYLFIAIIIFSSIQEANSQRRRRNSRRNSASYILQHEIGLNAGVANLQGDFAPDGPLDGLVIVNGFTVNGTHSMHFTKSRRRRRKSKAKSALDYLMIKSNIGYTKGSFDNLLNSTGSEDFSDSDSFGVNGIHTDILLGRITTETSIITFGTQLEFYFRNLSDYLHSSKRRSRSRGRYRSRRRSTKANKGNFYLAAGLGLNIVNSQSTYNLTTEESIILLENNQFLPDNWNSDVFENSDNDLVFSATAGLGYRYKLTRTMDMVAEMKYNYYTSDNIDAINPSNSPNIGDSGDKSNDYNTNITLGVIYHLF